MPTIKTKIIIRLLLVLGMSLSATLLHALSLERVRNPVELRGMHALAAKQQHSSITPFTTDGCSGGLSAGWQLMANAIPAFKRKFGDKPVYESCCVTHDKTYWQGSTGNNTEQGYDLRLEADAALEQCVIDVGQQHRDTLAREFDVPVEKIDATFKITAILMYKSVRIGGAPCNFMPWRWGYGWPQCSILNHQNPLFTN